MNTDAREEWRRRDHERREAAHKTESENDDMIAAWERALCARSLDRRLLEALALHGDPRLLGPEEPVPLGIILGPNAALGLEEGHWATKCFFPAGKADAYTCRSSLTATWWLILAGELLGLVRGRVGGDGDEMEIVDSSGHVVECFTSTEDWGVEGQEDVVTAWNVLKNAKRVPVGQPFSAFQLGVKFFGEKCRQHLSRVLTSFDLAWRNTSGTAFMALIENESALVQRAVGGVSSVQDSASEGDAWLLGQKSAQRELREALVECHFLLLKVEFEYFLCRLTNLLWEMYSGTLSLETSVEAAANALARFKVGDQERLKREKEFRKHIVGKDWETIRGNVPDTNLKRFFMWIAPTGLLLADAAGEEWAQVEAAFEVRHLIVHGNGRINAKSDKKREEKRARVLELLRQSSWATQVNGVRGGRKIRVGENDLRVTCRSMIASAEAITQAFAAYHA
jgi:hypothetical protein